jgi:glycosyltransferase involved in cell wall biosynthesis
VVMPVYNTGKYVGEAIQSILMQSFTDFEFIIVNDGSTDNSLEVINSFKDKRIKIINNLTNAGNYPARNKGHNIARGKYICVMDSDDVSTLNRLEKQFLYMETNPDVGISGGGFRIYGMEEDIFFRETDYDNIKIMLLRSFCFYHTALVFRHSFLKKYNLIYNEKYRLAADYDLVVRGARHFPLTNIPEDMFHYRIHDEQNSWKFRSVQAAVLDIVRLEQLKFIGIIPDADELNLHLMLLNKIPIEFDKKINVHNWIRRILTANQTKKYYDTEKLESFCEALLTAQPFLKRFTNNSFPCKEIKQKRNKNNIMDVTFLLILRIDSYEQIENTNVIIKYLANNFRATIRILEADKIQQYFPEIKTDGVCYEFVQDNSGILLKNRLIEYLIPTVHTSIFSVWNVDTIVPIKQVLEVVEKLRSGNTVMSLPYDGRIYCCDKIMSKVFKQTQSIDLLQKHYSAFELSEGWNSCEAVFFADKKRYMETGPENKNILNQKIADAERIKRMEVAGISILRTNGPVFRLWHPEIGNSISTGKETVINDRKEFLHTCSIINN